MNFNDYKNKARYAEQINAGYSARLNGKKPWLKLLGKSPEADAYRHGWEIADRHEVEYGQKSV